MINSKLVIPIIVATIVVAGSAFYLNSNKNIQNVDNNNVKETNLVSPLPSSSQNNQVKNKNNNDTDNKVVQDSDIPTCAAYDKISVFVGPAYKTGNLADAEKYFNENGLEILEKPPGISGGEYVLKLKDSYDSRKMWIDKINSSKVGIAQYHIVGGCDVRE